MSKEPGIPLGLNYEDDSTETAEELFPDLFPENPEEQTILEKIKKKKYLENDPFEEEYPPD